MNNLLKTLLQKLAPCIGFVALIASPAFAQTPHADIVAPPVEGRSPQIKYNILNPHPLPKRQHPLVDPKTGKPVACGTMILLPGGKSVEACKFWKEMDALEAELNKIGWSFWPGQAMAIGPLQGTPRDRK